MFCKEVLDKCLFSKLMVVSISLPEISEEPHRSDCKLNYFLFFFIFQSHLVCPAKHKAYFIADGFVSAGILLITLRSQLDYSVKY